MKRLPWFELLAALVVAAVHLGAAASDAYNFPANWFTRDDAYYYFKVAQNIAEGRGSTFDGLGLTNGYHPLWMLVCIPIFALARFDLILPLRVLLVVQGGLSAATAILLYRLVRRTLSHPVAMLAGCWWAFSTYIHLTMYEVGLESGLASLMVVVLVYALWKFESSWRSASDHGVVRRRVAFLAVIALLTAFSRLDLVFLALLAGAWIVLRGTPARVLLPLDLVVILGGVVTGFLARLDLRDYYQYGEIALTMALASVVVRIPLMYWFGLYRQPSAFSARQVLQTALMVATSGSLIVGALMLGLSGRLGTFPRSALITDWLVNVLGIVTLRLLAAAFARPGAGPGPRPLDEFRSSWRRWLDESAVYFGILGGGLSLYMLWNRIAIGAATPVSGQVKRWWGAFASRVYGGTARDAFSFWGLGFRNDFDTWRPFSVPFQDWSQAIAGWFGSYKPELFYPPLIAALVVVSLAVLCLNRRMARRGIVQLGLPPLLTGSLIQVLSYNVTGYAGMKEWYWISEPVFGFLAGCLLLAILLKPAQRFAAGRAGLLAVAGIAGLTLAWAFGNHVTRRMQHGRYPADLPYMESARFLEQNTPPGAIIGMTGGGNVGYYIQGRTIVNMDGLINSPEYFEALRSERAGDYLSGAGVDFVFANPEILRGPPYRGQYRTGEILSQYGGKALMELLP